MDDLADYPSLLFFLDNLALPADKVRRDFDVTRKFLLDNDQVTGTFGRYRTELQRFLNYLWLIAKRTLDKVDGDTLKSYLAFVECPPQAWISVNVAPAFVDDGSFRVSDPDWRPFSLRLSDTEYERIVAKKETSRTPEEKRKLQYSVSPPTLKAIRGSLRLFFEYLIEQELLDNQPFIHIKRSTRSRRNSVNTSDPTVSTTATTRRFMEWEWEYILETVTRAAEECPQEHERTLFVMATMKALFLRVSELSARIDTNGNFRQPVFGDFRYVEERGIECWVFTIYGKGGKLRQVTLPDAYLPYLKRWRNHLGLTTEMPIIGEQGPVLPSSHGGNLKTRAVANIYEKGVMLAVERLERQAETANEDDRSSLTATAERFKALKSSTHYLRHTGASQAINANEADLRFISEELGHASRAFTEKEYINADEQMKRKAGRGRKL